MAGWTTRDGKAHRRKTREGEVGKVQMDRGKRQAERKGQSTTISSPAVSPFGLIAPGSWSLTSRRDPQASPCLLRSSLPKPRVSRGNSDTSLRSAIRTLPWANVQVIVEKFKMLLPVFRQLRPTGNWPNTTGSDRWRLQYCPFEQPQMRGVYWSRSRCNS